MSRLGRRFYRRGPVTVARDLLGRRLVRLIDGRQTAGIIVETEAYLGIADQAAHTYNGRRTQRNEPMWGDGGHAYVYFTYGMHHCFNIVAASVGDPVAVLVRALEPTNGLEQMYQRRTKANKDTDLCSGPAKLCQAMAIDRALDGTDLVTSDVLFVEMPRKRAWADGRIVTSARIGIGYAGEWTNRPLRFFLNDNPHVSVL